MTHCSECGQHAVISIYPLRSYIFRGKKIEVEAEISQCINCQHETISMNQLKRLSELCLSKYEEE
jgi:hypothetical protein